MTKKELARLTALSHCAGWAAKIGPEDLAQVLSGLPPVTDPNVLVGTNTADDAAVYRLTPDIALIQTVDFFTPIADDPYWFGAIAAANSLSDVYAMGGEPICALNVVAFPRANEAMPLSALGEILRGGAEKAKEAGIDIVGGHTVDDAEPKYGLSVTGRVHPDRIWRNVGSRPGDKLVLTKPIGTGILSTAIREQKGTEEMTRQVLTTMAALNKNTAHSAHDVSIHACTDITGFGLLGHLNEMVRVGDVGARISWQAVPLLDGALSFAEEGFVPGGSRRNLLSVRPDLTVDSSISEAALLLLADAQTSGGLLFAVAAEDSGRLIAGLEQAGAIVAVEIGEILGSEAAGRIEVVP